MIEIPPDMPKEQVAVMLAKQNHGSSIVYLLEKAKERFDRIQRNDLPELEKDFLNDVEAKVKAAMDAMQDWTEDGYGD